MSTYIRKGVHGWVAETSVPLEGQRVLRFCTMKRSNGSVSTTAQCGESDGSFFRYVMFQDFNMRVTTDLKSARATEKTVTEQHRLALLQLDAIKAACEAHYAKEAA